MTDPEGGFDAEAPEEDVVEQLIPVDTDDEEGGLEDVRVSLSRDWDASEADLIDQSIAVPLADDDFDR